MPDPRVLLRTVVTRLIDDEAIPARLLDVSETAAILLMADGSLAALFTPAWGPGPRLAERLQALVDGHPGPIKLAIIGGGPEVRAMFPRAGGVLSRRVVQRFHLGPADEGPGWTQWTGGGARVDSPLGRALDAAAQGRGSALDVAALVDRVDAPAPPSPEERARQVEGQAFVESLRRRPHVTWGLLAVLAVVFACESQWGGSQTVPTLVRMGANTQDSLAGEPWRLLSSALLHAGIVHIGMNGYVLLMLGGFVEKVLGGARYGVLLGAAALGGGVASALVSPAQVSVGASGAIWGVLGSAAALAWRPGEAIPSILVPQLRRNAVINLALGLAISFVPQVDLWAHLGGGLAGAGLVWSGGLTRGVRHAGARGGGAVTRSRWFDAMAIVAAVVMAAALARAWARGTPWRLVAEPEWSEVEVGAGVAIAVPDLIADRVDVERSGPVTTSRVGSMLRDPLELDVMVIDRAAGGEALDDEIDRLSQEGLVAPPWARETTRASSRRSTARGEVFELEYTDEGGGRYHSWVQVRPEVLLRIVCAQWPWPDPLWERARQRMLTRLEDGDGSPR